VIDWTTDSSGRRLLGSVRSEFLRYKLLAEQAIEQVRDDELSRQGEGEPGSITTICWHVGGNLRSRFTDFLTSDGEKPWRNRDAEFDARTATRAELLAQWQAGWDALLNALNELTDNMLDRDVTIRGQSLKVHEALHRSLAHTSYHVGQVVHIAKTFRGSEWKSLSIPRGQSAAYNQNPDKERPKTH
jgi:uncharacterized damage-inducible protein DinB